MKLGRNDPCWCGFGKKYKHCHLRRDSEVALPISAVNKPFDDVLRKGRCWHPQASTSVCDKIINAHTVQRSRVLSQLIDESQHVLSFVPSHRRNSQEYQPRRVGWRKASTFLGFCARHDADTFKRLEGVPFKGTREQCFLLGYRALCHELHLKRSVVESHDERRQLIDRGLSHTRQTQAQNEVGAFTQGASAALGDLMHVKGIMDEALVRQDFRACQMVVVEFDGPVIVAGTGTITPDVDFSGRRLFALEDLDSRCEWLGVASDVTSTGGVVVFVWLATDEAPLHWVQSFRSCSPERQLAYLPQILFFHLENVYFKSSWWHELDEALRSQFVRLAGETYAEYSLGAFSKDLAVPWSNLRIRFHGVA